MKKSLYFCLVTILGLIGCTRNQEIDIQENGLTLFARTESPAESKTVVESGTHVYWEPGDEIAVFMGEKSAKFTTDITASSASATFKGTFGDTTWPEDLDLWAVYPFSEEAVYDGETITTVLPSEQIAREGSFGKDMNLAIAYSNSSTLQFYNVGGGIRFSVTEEGIKKVLFEGLSGEIISGKVKICLKDGLPVVTEVTYGSQFITLLPPSGKETFEKDTWYYIVAIPGALKGGYKLHFTKNGSSGAKASSEHVEIKRGIYGSIENADNSIEYISFDSVEVVVNNLLNTINEYVSNEESVSDLLEQRRDELEVNPLIKTLEIGEVATTLTLIDDRQIVFPYDFPSAFDDEEEGANMAPRVNRVASQQQVDQNKAAEVLRADVVIFNLFSRDSRRTNQNKMCEAIKQRFEEAGFNVCYCGYDDFTAQNVDFAIAHNAMVFFSTLGNNDGTRICLGETIDDYIEKSLNYTFVYSYKQEDQYKGDYHAWIEVSKLLGGYTGPLVYFASCNTMKQTFPENLNIIGWDGPNRVGQAYGLIIADYIAYHKKSFSAFKVDFLSLDDQHLGQIYDPIETNTQLVYSKTAEYWQGFHAGHGAVYDDTSWYLNQWQSDLIIVNPQPGSCINNVSLRLGWSTTYSVDMTYRNTQYATDGKTTRLGDYEYYVLLTNMSNLYPPDSYSPGVDITYHLKSISSGTLRIKDNKVSYAYDGFESGLWRIESKASNVLNGNNHVTDCSYALFSHKFKKNDGETYDFMPAPEVVTLGTMSGTNDLVLAGAVINRSLTGLETGFQYWKKDSPTNQLTIATTATYDDYFGAVLQIPDLDGEYEFRAFAKDEEGLIGYGDIMSFKYSGSQQEYAIPEAIDLGLPSGVKWASFNLGATAPEEYGDYFAWGETEPYYEDGYAQSSSPIWKPGKEYGYNKKSYSWNGGEYYQKTKYCYDSAYGYNGYTDNKMILDLEDDAARVHLGGKWRMPTMAEQDELRELCTWAWTSISGVAGRMVTGPNGNSIFLPAAGYRYNLEYNATGSNGWIWSSSLSIGRPSEAYGLRFRYESVDKNVYTRDNLGYSIRPVYAE